MTKLINMKGVVALAMALSFCVYSVVPNNSITPNNGTIVSEPITSYEAQDIKGGALVIIPLAWVGYALAADVVLIVGAMALYGTLEAAKQSREEK